MKVSIPLDVVFRDLGGEALIIHMGTGTYFGLDEIGTRIWQLLAKHGSIETAVTVLHREYEVDDADLRRDVEGLVRKLAESNLLNMQAAQAPGRAR